MKALSPLLFVGSMICNAARSTVGRVAALAMLAALVVGSPAMAQGATYTQTDWTDGVNFPIALTVISATLFVAGGAVMVAVYSPGLGFRFISKAVHGLTRFLRV